MVGPGTGVAPYLAFMQERLVQKATGGHWLFFGEWSRKTEFYFEPYWSSLVQSNQLRLDTAFSRDQEEKIYVQHRMWQQRKDLWRWLHEAQAYFYVCGDAKRMAPDVEKTLLEIITCEGCLSSEAAKAYLKRLRQEKRYQRDVY
jgi:sulfite reductase (NADPH) flavoprotein alpha-component